MFPKTGKKLHRADEDVAFAAMMAEALAKDLGRTHQAVKTAMRWTGASERSVKHWLAGTHAPRAGHLLALIRHSDAVLERLLLESGRPNITLTVEMTGLRLKLLEVLSLLDQASSEGRSVQLGGGDGTGGGSLSRVEAERA